MSNITSYYMERAERLRWLGVGKPQLHAPRLMPRTKAMVAAAASLARAKGNPNALPDRIELLLARASLLRRSDVLLQTHLLPPPRRIMFLVKLMEGSDVQLVVAPAPCA